LIVEQDDEEDDDEEDDDEDDSDDGVDELNDEDDVEEDAEELEMIPTKKQQGKVNPKKKTSNKKDSDEEIEFIQKKIVPSGLNSKSKSIKKVVKKLKNKPQRKGN
jgi:hypothetical protein